MSGFSQALRKKNNKTSAPAGLGRWEERTGAEDRKAVDGAAEEKPWRQSTARPPSPAWPTAARAGGAFLVHRPPGPLKFSTAPSRGPPAALRGEGRLPSTSGRRVPPRWDLVPRRQDERDSPEPSASPSGASLADSWGAVPE